MPRPESRLEDNEAESTSPYFHLLDWTEPGNSSDSLSWMVDSWRVATWGVVCRAVCHGNESPLKTGVLIDGVRSGSRAWVARGAR